MTTEISQSSISSIADRESTSPSITTTSNVNNHSKTIPSSHLMTLHDLGFKLVPLSENHVPAIKEWSPIYDNPDYWHKDRFTIPTENSRFTNVASTVGITHIKDSAENRDLYLQVFDVDSQNVCDILSKPISQLINGSDIFAPIVLEFLKSIGITDESKPEQSTTILDICKSNTFVTKTKKPYGYHIWWLSHNQNKSILSKDCKKEGSFEIKADKSGGLCTLPPSTHRNGKDFRYYHVGKTDELLTNDLLYNLFNEFFRE